MKRRHLIAAASLVAAAALPVHAQGVIKIAHVCVRKIEDY
jgi:hypothetical protein